MVPSACLNGFSVAGSRADIVIRGGTVDRLFAGFLEEPEREEEEEEFFDGLIRRNGHGSGLIT